MHPVKVRGRYTAIWVLKNSISITRCNFNSAGTHSTQDRDTNLKLAVCVAYQPEISAGLKAWYDGTQLRMATAKNEPLLGRKDVRYRRTRVLIRRIGMRRYQLS
jgi:hypothetical protein